ncbi:hypothetical protein DFQ27_006518 [Actinomortierella ambigua]|uniref:Uncharacterized protein n=1 Tax=Actinomortierella ambigua TaxID=1343610 RepID=A0A9P6PVJ4_9FUNG|nr:hypothetical protein DFQ27_006518 [Actinomortierella ambigua]
MAHYGTGDDEDHEQMVHTYIPYTSAHSTMDMGTGNTKDLNKVTHDFQTATDEKQKCYGKEPISGNGLFHHKKDKAWARSDA